MRRQWDEHEEQDEEKVKWIENRQYALRSYILYELIIALFICPIRIKAEIYCIYSFERHIVRMRKIFCAQLAQSNGIGVASFPWIFTK